VSGSALGEEQVIPIICGAGVLERFRRPSKSRTSHPNAPLDDSPPLSWSTGAVLLAFGPATTTAAGASHQGVGPILKRGGGSVYNFTFS